MRFYREVFDLPVHFDHRTQRCSALAPCQIERLPEEAAKLVRGLFDGIPLSG